MIADAMTSIKAYLYEKAVSPLLGSLIISWCVWNYKFLLMLVSGLSFPDKLRYINILYADNCQVYGQGIIFPFITSMVYLFVFPFPAKWVYQFSLKRQQVLNELKNKVQENELLTLEQSKAIRNQLAETEKHYEELVERKERALEIRDKELNELRFLIEKENSTGKSKNIIQSLVPKANKRQEQSDITPSQRSKLIELIALGDPSDPKTENEYFAKILHYLYSNGGSMKAFILVDKFRDRSTASYYLEELVRLGFIKYEGTDGFYALTHETKGAFIDMKQTSKSS